MSKQKAFICTHGQQPTVQQYHPHQHHRRRRRLFILHTDCIAWHDNIQPGDARGGHWYE